jgi:trk system potassium uptake protein TrkH
LKMYKRSAIYISPVRVLALSFLLIILVGTVLLSLPAASADGRSMGLTDALFTATSAVCVTGLVVVDTGTQLTLFGQVTLICLIQIGALGLMTMSTLIFFLLGKKITLRERLIMQEALNQYKLEGVVRLTKYILVVTFLIEGAGALLLAVRFIPLFGWGTGIYYSVFHSISAFCNAGFDLMGYYSGLTEFTGDYIINLVIMGLITLGGLGFTVILDLNSYGFHPRKWSLHTRIVIIMSLVLIFGGALFFLLVECNNSDTMARLSFDQKVLAAFFQSVSSRTAGMNTINLAGLTSASKFMTILLMFIGASPASTGGGIKTTTFSLILLMAWSVVKGRRDIVVFRKCIPHSVALRALAIALFSLLALIVVTMALSLMEFVPFIDILFQTASALGTVGLASMDTGGMQDISKIILSLTMFMGRVGPLSLTLAFARRQSRSVNDIRYPEERILVG